MIKKEHTFRAWLPDKKIIVEVIAIDYRLDKIKYTKGSFNPSKEGIYQYTEYWKIRRLQWLAASHDKGAFHPDGSLRELSCYSSGVFSKHVFIRLLDIKYEFKFIRLFD